MISQINSKKLNLELNKMSTKLFKEDMRFFVIWKRFLPGLRVNSRI